MKILIIPAEPIPSDIRRVHKPGWHSTQHSFEDNVYVVYIISVWMEVTGSRCSDGHAHTDRRSDLKFGGAHLRTSLKIVYQNLMFVAELLLYGAASAARCPFVCRYPQ